MNQQNHDAIEKLAKEQAANQINTAMLPDQGRYLIGQLGSGLIGKQVVHHPVEYYDTCSDTRVDIDKILADIRATEIKLAALEERKLQLTSNLRNFRQELKVSRYCRKLRDQEIDREIEKVSQSD